MRPDFLLFICLFVLFASVIALNRITQTHKVYLAFHFVMMLWPLGQFAVRTTDFPVYQLFYLNLSFVALSLLGPGWLIFVLFLTQRSHLLKSWRLGAYLAPALVCMASVVWNPDHAFLKPVAGLYDQREYGALFWLLTLLQFAYFSFALIIMFQAIRTVRSANERKQLATTLVGMFVLTVFAAIDLMVNVLLANWLPTIPGLMSLGILLSDICFVVAIYRYGMFDILSMAQRDLFHHLAMGIVVVDENAKVLEVNRSAAPFVRLSKGDAFEMEKFLAPLQTKGEVNEFLFQYRHHPGERMQTEISLGEGAGRHVSIQISPVLDHFKQAIGRVITFHDVTELRKLVDEMNRKNEALHERNLELIAIQEELFRVNQKLEQMAVTDGLTGCYNRRFLMHQLEHEVMLNARHRIPFSIFLFDIDFFKQINDRYGHVIGDEVIRATTDAVRSELRRTDIFARYGGEEFTVYLPHTSRQQAEVLADRIMRAVADNVVHAGGDRVSITISMGIVSEEDDYLRIDNAKEYLRDLFSRADAALYVAKNEGRNRIVYA
ncbi:histidine kinase N-terminal 7TM domain-containing diguanylate cyclase [Cohnella nanjingensis]|uniref:histidine kinase N-terminal 7TM domain-containing diguanylate cyclase n=1 Tax=Cohnella nanjingensis TaxID=1387779 RepID=UPI001FEA3275|nr:diguanylate cyclase [Cohnella nanjingensis]